MIQLKGCVNSLVILLSNRKMLMSYCFCWQIPMAKDDNDPVKVPKPDPIIIEIPQTYWEVFDPFVEEEPVCGDLLDDLSDIREDLLEGVCEYEAGLINNAVFEWKLLHHAHFGNHMVSAIKALQHLRSEH